MRTIAYRKFVVSFRTCLYNSVSFSVPLTSNFLTFSEYFISRTVRLKLKCASAGSKWAIFTSFFDVVDQIKTSIPFPPSCRRVSAQRAPQAQSISIQTRAIKLIYCLQFCIYRKDESFDLNMVYHWKYNILIAAPKDSE